MSGSNAKDAREPGHKRLEELPERGIGESPVNHLQRLEEACRKLQREYEREYGFPFNFALRDAHRELRALLFDERERGVMKTRALEPGDKVWLGGKVRLVFDVLSVGGVVQAASLRPDMRSDLTVSTWSGTATGLRQLHSIEHAVLLPPWIDEPHPLGEIQRVFAELHGEGVVVENYEIEKNLETCKKNALSILKNPGDHHPETLFQAEVVLRMWSRIVELEAAESEVKRLKDNQRVAAAAIRKLITALHEANVPLGTLDSFLGSVMNGG